MSTTDGSAVKSATAPRSAGAATGVALILALAVIALGVVGIQSALVAWNALQGTAWLDQVLSGFGSLTPQSWMLPVGVVVALAGLWLIGVAFKPRPQTSVAVAAQTGVFLTPREMGRVAAAVSETVDGVTSAKAFASRRRVRVAVRATGEDGVKERVTEAVTRRLEPLARSPRVSVTVRSEGES